ncbi:serine/threonine protein kinase [Candidatus Micrarchaeota archaeon]|nr:serine/threonine protein kinase [Candidatus Micrarchaeota archaeon]
MADPKFAKYAYQKKSGRNVPSGQTSIGVFGRSISGQDHNENQHPSSHTPNAFEGRVIQDTGGRVKRITKYRIGPLIGEGGTAWVHQGIRIFGDSVGTRVAIKILKTFLDDTEGARHRDQNRFRLEGELLVKVDGNLNILRCYGCFSDEQGNHYLVLELLEEGDSLRNILDRESRMRVDLLNIYQKTGIATEITLALAALHAQGIIHRDLKPDNIFICPDVAKLLDLGIAHHQEKGRRRITDPGVTMGTIAYMSPEQARGLQVGPPADLYSLGTTLYELFALELPYGLGRGDDPFERLKDIQRRICRGEMPLSVKALAPRISPKLNDIIMKLFLADPVQRYPNAEEVIKQLKYTTEFVIFERRFDRRG